MAADVRGLSVLLSISDPAVLVSLIVKVTHNESVTGRYLQIASRSARIPERKVLFIDIPEQLGDKAHRKYRVDWPKFLYKRYRKQSFCAFLRAF